MGDRPRADEGDVGDSGMGSEMIRCRRPADEGLDKVRGVTAR